ncbi:MAG TPA: AraC family transcriptional regulator [Candidatus Saccharimonadales bacterium]|nr:AraC family transcriptional regulator [Candidatus Saccharimonadales bacterium]
MTKSFQKTAKIIQELQQPHPGIIDSENFNKHFELHCYKPSPDLQPFLVHLWVQRLHATPEHKPIEIASGPNIYLFFTPKSAFIHGVSKREFNYDPFVKGAVAGVKFRPGGFYPFLKRPVCDLEPDITAVFPVDKVFREKLLNQPDEMIVTMLETMLRNKRPQGNKKLDLITKILEALDNDPSLQTVETIARTFGLSERSLQMLFRTHVGVGLKWIIARRRLLGTISRMRTNPRCSWTNAAVELGYSSQSHFSREFSKTIGQPPSKHRHAS